MFCPKCGTQNPDGGKFCRSCGTDLGTVSAAIAGNLPTHYADAGVAAIEFENKKHERRMRRRQDPHEVYGDAIKQIISGIGFLVVALVLLTTNVAGGFAWWWAMLFPAFGLLSGGISNYLKSKRMEKSPVNFAAAQNQNRISQSPPNASLPPTPAEYVAPDSRYKTGDLVPPSIVENTTRHLEINNEGETMALPKK